MSLFSLKKFISKIILSWMVLSKMHFVRGMKFYKSKVFSIEKFSSISMTVLAMKFKKFYKL